MLRRASVQTNMEAEDEEKHAHHSRTEGISILLIFYFCYLFFPVMYRYIVQIIVFFRLRRAYPIKWQCNVDMAYLITASNL